MMNFKQITRICLIIVSLFFSSTARSGIDLSISIDFTTLSSYLDSSSASTSFAIIQGLFYNATVNTAMITSIRTIWDYGIRDISLYIYPCISSSPYALNNNLDCGTAQSQINQLIIYLAQHNIHFRSYRYEQLYTVNDHNLPTWNTTDKSLNITLQTLYIIVEDNTPNYYYSYNHYTNVDFLINLVNYTESHHEIEVGFYTTWLDWMNIMTDSLSSSSSSSVVYFLNNGSAYLTANPFKNNKLWVPRYDQTYTMDFFGSFAGWKAPYVKQITGGASNARRLGSTRICVDYIVDVDSSSTTSSYYVNGTVL